MRASNQEHLVVALLHRLISAVGAFQVALQVLLEGLHLQGHLSHLMGLERSVPSYLAERACL